MATKPTSTVRLSAADRRAIGIFVGTAALIMGLPVALATYAQSRPLSEAECIEMTCSPKLYQS